MEIPSQFQIENTRFHSTVMIFYDQKADSFLLERRPPTNLTYGGEIVFPGEKGFGPHTINSLERGIDEEMGVTFRHAIVLPKFWGSIGKLGDGIIQPIIITQWFGEIVNREKEKGEFMWVDRKDVMETLTLVESKLLFLISVHKLTTVQKELDSASKMSMSELPR